MKAIYPVSDNAAWLAAAIAGVRSWALLALVLCWVFPQPYRAISEWVYGYALQLSLPKLFGHRALWLLLEGLLINAMTAAIAAPLLGLLYGRRAAQVAIILSLIFGLRMFFLYWGTHTPRFTQIYQFYQVIFHFLFLVKFSAASPRLLQAAIRKVQDRLQLA
jgi:hypothetical protein